MKRAKDLTRSALRAFPLPPQQDGGKDELHGEAGEALSRKIGPVGFLAREIPGEIPALLDR